MMIQNTTEGKAANKKVELIRVDRLYESLRYNEYTPANGLGEIVDNSVEAGSTRIDVRITKVKESRSKGKSRTKIEEIAVVDNGCGMDAVTLSKCLALGESLRTTSKGKLGIGRFGVGMTLGSISLARRVEVYSRTNVDSNFLYTYIDLEEIKNCELLHIPFPKPNAPHEKYRHLLDGCTGTIVVLKDCDRIEGDWEGLANYLGRTYRKFIERGLKITIGIQAANEAEFRIDPVYLHDPLYMAGPTKFDADAKAQGKPMDPKAVDWGTIHIPLEISNQPGKTADVIIRLTLLPEEWRMFKGDGGNAEAKKRRIPENEGVSILRADREVLYGHVPYLIGAKGAAKAEDIDRFWGCEISFPPELDNYFQVRYIKRGAEPIESLKNQIKDQINQYIISARKVIRELHAKNKAAEDQSKNVFENAEHAMAEISHNFPLGINAKDMMPKEEENKLTLVAKESLATKRNSPQAQKEAEEKKKEELRSKPYSMEPVSYPRSVLFDTVHTPKSLIIKLNVNHPFYDKIMKPLCDQDGTVKATPESRETWDAILMMLFAYAKAETMFSQQYDPVFEQLRTQWSAFLATVIDDTYRR